MTAGDYPRERVERLLNSAALPLSYRIFPKRHLTSPLGTTPADSRFSAKGDGFTVLYAAPDFATAFIEVVVRDRFTRQHQRQVLLKELTERAWALISTKRRAKLTLLDLRDDGCVRIGAPTDAINARNHAAGRALGRAVHFGHRDVDGLIFSSRLTGADVYAVFDRGITRLDVTRTGTLTEHPELPEVLSTYGVALIAT